jgi:hypothetical protein
VFFIVLEFIYYFSIKLNILKNLVIKRGDFMLFAAVHMHPASECPLNSDEGKNMIKDLFSEESMKKNNVEVKCAHVSCPKDEKIDHKGFFIVEADGMDSVKNFFGPMTVEIREVVPFSEVAKTL